MIHILDRVGNRCRIHDADHLLSDPVAVPGLRGVDVDLPCHSGPCCMPQSSERLGSFGIAAIDTSRSVGVGDAGTAGKPLTLRVGAAASQWVASREPGLPPLACP